MFRKISFLLTLILILTSIITFPASTFAISRDDFDEWFQVYDFYESNLVAQALGVRAEVNGHYINKHFLNREDNPLLVYGEPYDWVEGHGYRYLGYSSNGVGFTNQDYIPDKGGSFDPINRDWIKEPWKMPHKNLIKAQGLPWPIENDFTSTQEWMKNATWTNTLGQTFKFTDFGIPENELYLYATVLQEPGEYTQGAIRLYHYRSGQYWYITLLAPPKEKPVLDPPTIDIKVKSQTSSESYNITVKEGEEYEVLNRCKAAYEDIGNQIIRYEVKKEKKVSGSWQTISNMTLIHNSIRDDRDGFFKTYIDNVGEYRYTITEVEDLTGKVASYTKTAYVTVSSNEEPPAGPPEEPIGDINAVITGPSSVEKGDTLILDSSSSTSTYSIIKREWYRKAGSTGSFTYFPNWDNQIVINDDVPEDTDRSYYEYKLVITDSKGNTDETIHRVDLLEKAEVGVNASLMFDPEQPQLSEPILVTPQQYLNNEPITVDLWLTAKNTTYSRISLGGFWFFSDVTEGEINHLRPDIGDTIEHPNFFDYIEISTRTDPDSINDTYTRGTFTFTPQNPTVKAALIVRNRNGTTDDRNWDYATAYHTLNVEVDSQPPETQLNIPEPFYPKEVDVPENKTITWDYYSEDNIPYSHSIVSLYRIDNDIIYPIYEDKIQSERELFVDGNAGENYKIKVKVVDQLNKSSGTRIAEFTITNATPVIDLTLDTSTEGILGITVQNLTPMEIENLFPTSYTNWKIANELGETLIEGTGKAPETVNLDERFKRGEYKVIQRAINTVGATAQASKKFYIISTINFIPEPQVQFESDMIYLNDTSKHITNKSWYVKNNTEIEFSPLELSKNMFTKDEGTYQVKLKGIGYIPDIGEQEMEITKTVTFLSTKPRAGFILGGYLKMYKEIILDGSVSVDMTNAELQAKYPIDFTDERTMFVVEPILEPNGEVDISRVDSIKGEGKEVKNNRVAFKGKQYISIRIDNEGWYRAKYKVYNGRKESDWYIEEFYVSPELLPLVDINVGSTIVYRDPNNELKSKLEVIVDYSSPDDKINLSESKLLISYDRNNDGNFYNDGLDSSQWIMKDKQYLLHYISQVNADWQENKATFTLYIDNADKNIFGRFKFEFIAVEEPIIPNKNDIGNAPIMEANTFMLDDKKKIIFIDNKKPVIHLETSKDNTFTIWLIEDSNKPFTQDELDSLIQSLSSQHINVEIYIIDTKTGEIEKYK